MSEQEQPGDEGKRRPPSGPVSSPRAYFGRASRAATGALRAGISEVPEPGPAAPRKVRPVYRAGDPALRLFAGFALPLPATTPITGAVATLSGIRDGEHEKLFIDLGTSLVRATPRRDEKAAALSLILSRTQSAETYGGLLASLRYVNDAATPTNGVRRIVLQTIDAGGIAKEVAAAAFGVGEAPPEAETDIVVADERIVLGEKQRFNSDGDYTLFWWPRLLPGAADRARRGRPMGPEPESAVPAGSYFSGGGKRYRLFDPDADAALPTPGAAQTAANDRVPPALRAVAEALRHTPAPLPRMLRLEDVFGSDMQDAIARRLIEQRLANR